ncbi:hypothetical protein UFOVP354_39 [uncultured Caudovirales phage]|uniref:Uncharacterized protein n=1 Tax=uncultured Caudovirales phage TaxID=2100421 RepID=A0A6J5M0M6_9CAUD|nr:hypothetical protein UFOVP354_39 [uncultured Caudovirales phage]
MSRATGGHRGTPKAVANRMAANKKSAQAPEKTKNKKA